MAQQEMSNRPEIHTGGKVVYLAGPMSGYPEFNFPRFRAVTMVLRMHGHEVFSPAEADMERHGTDISKGNVAGDVSQCTAEHKFDIGEALDADLHFICTRANAIFLLPGWELSFGSLAEHATAVALKKNKKPMEIVYLTERECENMERTVRRIDDLAFAQVLETEAAE